MCAYTHGGWEHRQRVSTTFLTLKNKNKNPVLLMGFEPRPFGSSIRRSTYWVTLVSVFNDECSSICPACRGKNVEHWHYLGGCESEIFQTLPDDDNPHVLIVSKVRKTEKG